MAVTTQPELTIVVPAYNEAGTIEAVVERLRELPFELQIIVVDDCSRTARRDRRGPRRASSSCATSATRARAPRCARGSPMPAAGSS